MGWRDRLEELTTTGVRRRSCPPHGPLLVDAVEESIYIIKCLSCGLWGPERDDTLQAKMAFDEPFEAAH